MPGTGAAHAEPDGSADTPTQLLSLDRVTARRDGRKLFEPLTLSLAPGACVALTGVNGVGKSTLLRAIAGLFPDISGEIEHRGVCYLGHQPGLSALLTAAENLAWYDKLAGGSGALDMVRDVLDRVALRQALHVPCGKLSQGQQRRVGLARVLLSRQRVWLLDEPLTALDGAGQALVRELLSAHCAAGGAALCATHQALGVEVAKEVTLVAAELDDE